MISGRILARLNPRPFKIFYIRINIEVKKYSELINELKLNFKSQSGTLRCYSSNEKALSNALHKRCSFCFFRARVALAAVKSVRPTPMLL